MPVLDVIGLTLPRLIDPRVAIAVSRAGGVGVLDLQWGSSEVWCDQAPASAAHALQALATFAKGRWGVKLDGEDEAGCDALVAYLKSCRSTSNFDLVVLTEASAETISRQVARLRAAVIAPKRVLLEITQPFANIERPGIDGFVAKGNEAGGLVGAESTFILLQRLADLTSLPVFAHGGIGLHSVAACHCAGVAGVVLDAQLCLSSESALSEAARRRIARMDGSETGTIGDCLEFSFRGYQPPGLAAKQNLAAAAEALQQSCSKGSMGRLAQWKRTLQPHIAWDDAEGSVWPLGQDAATAKRLAQRFKTAGRIVHAIRQSADRYAAAAHAQRSLAEGSALAQSHGTRFPIVQGPMTRVSDNAAFALEVAKAGGLPFVSLALFDSAETRRVLQETRAALEHRAWGVGILGFVPLPIRTAQLEVIRDVKPAFVLIAGGRPDQAFQLEQEGIATYLHTPSPDLLKLFIEQGARRFVFEGRECGGHVGPRSSFALWDAMIDALCSLHESGTDLSNVHVLFAGGIHDALSAAMVAALAAPLAEMGMKTGILMGTAYLFTHEAVSSGAIKPDFQSEAVCCEATSLLATGPGHATRCARTPFVACFDAERRRMTASGVSQDELRNALEALNLGRLRLAAKGVTRTTSPDGAASKLIEATREEQKIGGMYMLGQLATLRRTRCTIEELHRDVVFGGSHRLERIASSVVAESAARPCDVAIIGMATLFPRASNARTFWHNIIFKVDAITEIPQHRFDWRLYFDPDPSKPDKIYSKWGGFLDDVAFDPVRYGIPPATIPSIEPMQLLTLEAVRAAIEEAGYADGAFARAKTSVILGAGGGLADLGQQYGMRAGLPMLGKGNGHAVQTDLPEWTEDSFAGLLLNVAAGRVANRFDLGGVNFTVDAACASSLAAIYAAVKELESKSSDVVIAGGVDTVQNPFGYLCFSATKALSPNGRCRPFDTEANGTVISEGLAVLVLKRLADAERDGDCIYAVIKSVAGSSDGRDKGLTAPRPEGQVAALKRAYATAGVSPGTVGMIEAHGTGTVAGDAAEVEALKRVFSAAPRQSCIIGSVKSMIGHTKCAAGAASLVKAALALHDKVLPPTLNVDAPNPKADFPASPFFVNTEARPWLARLDGEPRRAGVSAFGFGGTNFHVVLEEYQRDPSADKRPRMACRWPSEMFVWSADCADMLRVAIADLRGVIDAGAQPEFAELAAATWRAARSSIESAQNISDGLSLAVVATDLNDLRSKLSIVESQLTKGSTADIADPRGIYLRAHAARPALGKIAFLFPGQGSQQVNMLADLAIYFDEVRQCFETADRALSDRIPEKLSSHIFPPSQFTEQDRMRCRQSLQRTEITQPAMGAADFAMFKLLRALGLQPGMVAGHSYGEYVALAAAGALTESELYALSEARGRCLAESARADAGDSGGMLAVFETADRIADIVKGISGVWISNLNAPRQTTLSGHSEGIAVAAKRLSDHAVEAKPIPVSCAFHSPLMRKAKKRLASVLVAAAFTPPRLPVFSNTTADIYPSDAKGAAALLAEHLVRPVRFKDQIEAMYEAGARIFVEVGPGAVLTGLVGQILAERSHLALSTNSALDQLTRLQHALARLIVEGISLSLDHLYERRVAGEPDLSIPTSPPAGTWLVNGGRARRLGEPALRTPVTPGIEIESPKPKLGRAELPPPPSPLPETGLTHVGTDVDRVMVNFQKMMTRFLDIQREAMTAYLAVGGHADRTSPNTPATSPQPQDSDARKIEVPAGEPRTVAAAITAVVPAALDQRLLAVISERTGYPRDMLKPTLNLEADLGIDSIKRVEIVGAFQRDCSPVEQQRLRGAMEKLTSLKTIGALIEALGALMDGSASPQVVKQQTSATPPEPIAPLPRMVLTAVETNRRPSGPLALPSGAVLVTDDGRGVATALQSLLEQAGWPVVIARADFSDAAQAERLVADTCRAHSRIAALIHLVPLRGGAFPTSSASCAQQIALETNSLFNLAKAAARNLRMPDGTPSTVLAATCLGGDFGVSATESSVPAPLQGGVIGIIKTLNHEWPDVHCKVIDFEAAAEASSVAQQLFAELSAGRAGSPVEIGYRGTCRIELRLAHAALPVIAATEPNAAFHGNPVILVTGGARGITAKVALALAARHNIKLILVGRSPLPPEHEPPETSGITAAPELKSILIAQMRRAGVGPEPPRVEAAHARLLRDREIRANLQALRETGAHVQYLQCDLADADKFERLIDEVYAVHGSIDGVIHGAGVIEDRLVEDKESASFDRVIAAKVTGALALARKLRFQSLRFFALFSSVSGRFGNRGQVDYAAANEMLNKLAAHLDARWPCRVVALNWGPWDGSNMVTPAVREQFLQRGVGLIAPDAGCQALLHELTAGRNPEVILGDGPWCATDTTVPEFTAEETPVVNPVLPLLEMATPILGAGFGIQIQVPLDPGQHLYLNDHRIDGKSVLPAAMAVELMVEVALKGWPDWIVTGIKSVRVCKGVILESNPLPLSISAKPQTHYSVEDAGVEVEVEIKDAARTGLIYYRATVCLARGAPAAPKVAISLQGDSRPFPLTVAEAYKTRLFHGGSLQCLEHIHDLTEDGIRAAVRPSLPADCLRNTQAAAWVIDPVLLDAGPQLAILWARETRGITVLPARIGEIHIFRRNGVDTALQCRLITDHSVSDETIIARFEVFAPDGRLIMAVNDLELVGSKALNRLAVTRRAFGPDVIRS